MSRPSASDLVAASRAYLGTPFRHQGRRSGLDCLGLVSVAHRDAGLRVLDRTDYGRLPDLARMKAALDGQLVRLTRTTPLAAGMVALFEERLRPAHYPVWLHLGLMTGPASFIHARGPEELGPGVVEHRLDEQSWAPRLLGLWRHPDLGEG